MSRQELEMRRRIKQGLAPSDLAAIGQSDNPRAELERRRSLANQPRPGLVDATPEQLNAGIQGLGQGASLGFSDEIQAGLRTLIPAVGPGGKERTFGENLELRRQELRELEANNPEAFATGQFAGSVATGAAIGGQALKGAQTITRALTKGAGQGAAIGGASAAGFSEGEIDDRLHAAFEGAAKGAGFGAAFAGIAATPQMLSRVVQTDAYRSALKTLSDAGVKGLTVGQSTGSKTIRKTETSLGEIPVAGALINRQIKVGRLQYQRALLETTGLKGARLVNRETLEKARNKIRSQYQQALRGKTVNLADPQFSKALDAIEAKHSELLPFEQKRQIQSVVDDLRAKAIETRGIAGTEYQRVRSVLGTRAFKTRDPAIADLYRDLRDGLDDQFQRSAPTPELVEINKQYANLASLEDVVRGRGGAEAVEGFVAPSAIAKVAAKGRNSTKFKEIAEAGSIVLPDRTPNSATATRAAVLGFLGAGGGAAIGTGNVSTEDAIRFAMLGTLVSGTLTRGRGIQSALNQGAGTTLGATGAGTATAIATQE